MNRDEDVDAMEVEIDVPNESRALVLSSVSRRLSGFSDSQIPPTVSSMRKFAQHLKILKGRAYWSQMNALTKEAMATEEYASNFDLEGNAVVAKYQACLVATQLKNRLELHPFYSKVCVNIHRKRSLLNAEDSLRVREIAKHVGIVVDKALAVKQLIANEDKLYGEYLDSQLASSSFVQKCQTTINESQHILRQQVIDVEKKKRIATARKNVMTLAEVCSRFLAVAPNNGNLDQARLIVRDSYLKLLSKPA